MNEEQATAVCADVSAAATDVLLDRLKGAGEMEPDQMTQILVGCLTNQILTMGLSFVPREAIMTKQEILITITKEVIEKLIDTIAAYLESPDEYLVATSKDGQVMDWSDFEGWDE